MKEETKKKLIKAGRQASGLAGSALKFAATVAEMAGEGLQSLAKKGEKQDQTQVPPGPESGA